MSARTFYSPEPMKYHGPGWSIDFPTDDDGNGELLQVWAPRAQDGEHPARDLWQASWTRILDGEDDPEHGGFAKAATLDDALMDAFVRHPDYAAICEAFRRVALA